MDILIKASQFILSLSLLIVAHELGHFLFAKMFKTRVEKFYLFFDPWFSLFKIKRGDTEYGIGWLPLGGYVKISGMIDESMDKEALKEEPQPWEFRTKPTWQRLLIMIGGVSVNFVLAIVIYAMVLFVFGNEYIPVANAKYGFEFNQTALNNGFQNGDRIISVDDVSYEFERDVVNQILFGNAKNIAVERDGEMISIGLPSDFTAQYLSTGDRYFMNMLFPWVIDRTVTDSPAAKAGLMHGDQMIAVNDVATPTIATFMSQIGKNAGQQIVLTIKRNDIEQTIPVQVGDDGKIGVYPKQITKILDATRVEYGFISSFPAGIKYGVGILTGYVKSLKVLFTREGTKQLGGFITIGSIFPATWDWQAFWMMTAFLSLIVAFMNILPIPALDGGHVLFLLYEIISGRKPSEKFLIAAQYVGMILLLGLLILANGNDIFRLFSK